MTKGDIFQIRFSRSNEKIGWKCSLADFTNVWDPSTCWLSRGVLKRCFLKSGLTKSFTVCNFRNKVAMTIIFFFKMLKIWCRFRKWNKKVRKKVSVLKIIAFESGTKHFPNPEQDICHWQSMCYERQLRCNISLRAIFSKYGSLRVMKKYEESVLMQILQEFGTLWHVDSQRVFWHGVF